MSCGLAAVVVNRELQEFSRAARLSITFCLLYMMVEKAHHFHLCTQPDTQLLLIDKTSRCANFPGMISQVCSIYQAKVVTENKNAVSPSQDERVCQCQASEHFSSV